MTSAQLEQADPIRSDLDHTDRVVLYPTFGHQSADGKSWYIGVSGVVFEPGRESLRKRMLLRVLQRLMSVPAAELQSELFQDRISCFLVDTERGKRVAVRIGDRVQMLQRPSKRNGHFRGSLQIAAHDLAYLSNTNETPTGWLDVNVVSDHATGKVAGQTQLIGQTGISVISDIDDTIKMSDVADRRRLLRNTFLHEYEAVGGMSEIYQDWAVRGAAFHYVSSSPWQLYASLEDLLTASGFPAGSFHLRNIRLRDPSVLRLLFARRSGKRRIIHKIVKMFPHRQFLLVGDSGERDPEIYGHVARCFPKQIQRIVIRRVEGRQLSDERLKKAFRNLQKTTWQVFDHPSELKNLALSS
ncbi:MAG: DUF2183 domain-containing protein [Pirellulaceae bacterium]|nr:DUF2183 domain-containing protein [Pirellulaceae bacterium]